jgi:hypothetical protein
MPSVREDATEIGASKASHLRTFQFRNRVTPTLHLVMSIFSSRRILPLALATFAPLSLLAQGKPETGGFVVRLGKDTMVVERYVRTADRIESWSVNRQPVTIRRHFVLTLKDGMPTRMEYEGGRADGSQPMSKLVFEYGRDTTTVTVTRGDSTQTLRVPAGGVVPALGNSFALTELAVARFLAAKADSTAIATLPIGAPRPQPLSIKRVAKNTLHVDYFGAPWVTTLDSRGRIVAVDGSQSAGKITVERVADVDVEALTKDFAARDAQGKGFGVASPADSVRATIGSARLAIDYSRPAKRGRQLLGNLVPLDTVWRTGANAATMFTTSATLDIGGTTVPAGTYTLWTRPTTDGRWHLVVNKQTKQWGTEYDSRQDFARIPMTVNKAAAGGPEHFLIAIEPKGANEGTLRMTWADIDVSVPITVKSQSASN